MTFICYPKCTTCQKARTWLDAQGISYVFRDIKLDNPAAEELRQEPCLLLEMRLGEGSGCPLMFQIMRAACAVLCEMATFEEASIHDGYLDEIRKTDAFTVARP